MRRIDVTQQEIHGYLACGKPLIYVGPDGSNVTEAICNYDCGFRVGEEDLRVSSAAWPALPVARSIIQRCQTTRAGRPESDTPRR